MDEDKRTVETLGKKAGIGFSTIASCRQGQRNATFTAVENLAQVMGYRLVLERIEDASPSHSNGTCITEHSPSP